MIFKIAFTPTKVSQDIRYTKLPCVVENSPSPLFLTLVGSCVPQSDNETLVFKTAARKKQTKSITLTNNTQEIWRLKPTIENEYWSGSKTGIWIAFSLQKYCNRNDHFKKKVTGSLSPTVAFSL